jgi:hypothetical protein
MNAYLERETAEASRRYLSLFGLFVVALSFALYRSWRWCARKAMSLERRRYTHRQSRAAASPHTPGPPPDTTGGAPAPFMRNSCTSGGGLFNARRTVVR